MDDRNQVSKILMNAQSQEQDQLRRQKQWQDEMDKREKEWRMVEELLRKQISNLGNQVEKLTKQVDFLTDEN